jgi:hypothetical protein
MDNVKYVTIKINDNYKKTYSDWVESYCKKIPTTKFNLKVKKNEIVPDAKYIWYYIMEFIDIQLYTIIVEKYNNIIENNDYHSFIMENFNDIKHDVLIPVLTNINSFKRKCFTTYDMQIIERLLNDYPNDRILILTMLKKIMGYNLYNLCFDSLSVDNLLIIHYYDLTDILYYYDYSILSYRQLVKLDKSLPDTNYDYTWKYYKNNYVYMERYGKKVRLLNVEDILSYKSFDMEYDNNILIIKSDYICDIDIKSLEDLNEYFIGYMFKKFEPVTNLEKMILGTVNKYAIVHGTSWCTYRKILRIVKNIFKYHLWNKSCKILKYSLINPKNKKRLYSKQMEFNNYNK